MQKVPKTGGDKRISSAMNPTANLHSASGQQPIKTETAEEEYGEDGGISPDIPDEIPPSGRHLENQSDQNLPTRPTGPGDPNSRLSRHNNNNQQQKPGTSSVTPLPGILNF